MKIAQIVAITENRGIGKDNDLLCPLPADLKFFKNTTTGHHIIMGRKNHESIGRPLPNRTNIVITRNEDYQSQGCVVKNNVADAIDYAKENGETEAFIIGGAQIYEQTLPLTDVIYLTLIHHSMEADAFYPELPENEWIKTTEEKHFKDEKNPFDYSFIKYERKQS